MGKLEINLGIKNLQGEYIKVENNTLTVGKICQAAILNSQEKDREKKYKLYKLAEKLEDENSEYTSEELVKIKECVGDLYPPLIVGRIYDIIEK